MSVLRKLVAGPVSGRTRFATFVDIADNVKLALAKRHPVVALESTIITHGMPVPENFNTALQVEEIIKEQGAVPATIGVIQGRIKVGLTRNELQFLADVENNQALKVSRRDLPRVVAEKLNGGTTVAATMAVAHMAGIPIFVTGGIGGVHRGAESSWDVSADLTELGRTPVAVICSGVKSILDIGRTLEVLETEGVGVATYGSSDDFPAFYCRKSGFKSPCQLNDIDAAVRYVHAMQSLQLGSGLIIAVPVPENHALNENEIEEAIQSAVQEADRMKVSGPRVTPFILKNLSKVTEGKALAANMALVRNNALVGAGIAVGLATCKSSKRAHPAIKPTNKVTVIGGSVLDFVVRVTSPDFKADGRTMEGKITFSGGGVARNMADALTKLGANVNFISSVGEDQFGKFIKTETLSHVDSVTLLTGNERTPVCLVVCDSEGNSRLLVGDMNAHRQINPSALMKCQEEIINSRLVVLDGNVPAESIKWIFETCHQHKIPVFFEPTDLLRAKIPFQVTTPIPRPIQFITPNLEEFWEIVQEVLPGEESFQKNSLDSVGEVACRLVEKKVDNVLVTLGPDGVLIARRGSADKPFFSPDGIIADFTDHPSYRIYPPPSFKSSDIVNVNGAGDCFASGFVTAMLRGLSERECVFKGLCASQVALKSWKTVPEDLGKSF